MSGTRWVWLHIAEPAPLDWDWITQRFWNDMERQMDGMVLGEAPRGIGCEVRLATLQETGIWAMKALPATTGEPKP